MRSGSQLVYAHVGSPPVEECGPVEPGMCWLCAGDTVRGMQQVDWQGASFVGQNRVKVPSSPIICEACVYVCQRTAPVPGRPPKDGKKYGGNFRNYSHLGEVLPSGALEYLNASKGEKPLIMQWLRTSHSGNWFAAIADSGQKHVLPWVPINPGGQWGGRVLFDETTVRLPGPSMAEWQRGWHLVDEMSRFLTDGATKEEIETGEYTGWTFGRGADRVFAFEDLAAPWRHSSWFTLAIWLAQRDEAAAAERVAREKAEKKERENARRESQKAATRSHRAGAAGDKAGVPAQSRRKPAQGVGPDPGPPADGGTDGGRPRGVADQPEQEPATRAAQLALF